MCFTPTELILVIFETFNVAFLAANFDEPKTAIHGEYHSGFIKPSIHLAILDAIHPGKVSNTFRKQPPRSVIRRGLLYACKTLICIQKIAHVNARRILTDKQKSCIINV